MTEKARKKPKREMREEMLTLLGAISETQQQMLELLEEQSQITRERIEQSLQLQEAAVKRQKQALVAGIPIIVVCIGLIAFLVWRFLL